jgi:hypothetical protein
VPVLSDLRPVTSVEHLGTMDGRHRYALDTIDPSATAPLVAHSVCAAGWDLYGLQPQVTDLETLFGAVNEQEEATHA